MTHRGAPVGGLGLRVALVAGVAVMVLLLWGVDIPLGVPGEWTWPRIDASEETVFGTLIAAVVGGLYIAFAWLGHHRLAANSRWETAGWVGALVTAAFGWLWIIQDCVTPPSDLGKAPWVLYFPRSSGYFWQARYEVEDAAELLAGYEELLAQRDYLHIGTHPPGLALGYRGLLWLCRNVPGLSRAVAATQPESVRTSFAPLQKPTGLPVTTASVDADDIACLWLAALLTQTGAALTTGGMFLLLRRYYNRPTAWSAACLWPLVPTLAVFLPKSDVLLPLPAVMTGWLWLSGLDRGSWTRCALAGLVGWCGMMLSLAFVTIVALIVVMTVWERWITVDAAETAPASARSGTGCVTAAVAGFAVPTLIVRIAFDCNLLNVWSWNVSNHALFYEHNTRTYWMWLWVNLVELSLAVGLPVVIAAAVGTMRQIRKDGWRKRAASPAIAFALVGGLLWVSGKNMGEAARLWILMMPWVVMSAAPLLRPVDRSSLMVDGGDRSTINRQPSTGPSTLLVWLLAAQLLVSIATVLRVDGFHFRDLLQPDQPAQTASLTTDN